MEDTKKRNVWKYIALAETVAVLSGGVIFAIYSSKHDSLPAINAQVGEISEQMDGNEAIHTIPTVKIVDNLAELTAMSYPEHNNDFQASVEQLFGYEYLCFTSGDIKVYYRNEFPEGDEKRRCNVMIDNGTKLSEFNWDYDFTEHMDKLCPYYGSFLGDSEKQIIFPIYTDKYKNIPTQLRVVEADNLNEYESMEVAERINHLFTLSFSEDAKDLNHPEYRMKLSSSAASYTYAIEKEAYMNAVYYDEYLLKIDDYFKMNIDENGIEFSTVLNLSENEFLGELKGTIVLNNGELSIGHAKYSAYVSAAQEDTAGDGVITPRTEVLGEERITMWGKHRETFLIPISDLIARNTLINDNFTTEGIGKAYYENGVKQSKFGIDVSKYQGDVDWKTVKDAGVEFVIIRAGFRGNQEGTLEVDPYFEQNIKGANEAGIPVGVYFFSQAISVKEAEEEADFVLDLIKDYKVSYPVVFDTEEMASKTARANNLSVQLRTDLCKTFGEKVKAAGYHPMIYANSKWLIMGLDLEQLSDYDIWYAYYGNDLTFPYKFNILQYSQEGKVPGIQGSVDLNITFDDYSAITQN